MRFGSLCSGIEAASVAWHPLGWRAAFFSEIAKFPSAVLAHHYPNVPNYGDMRGFETWPDADIDVLCGGTPCQSFSVAGLREGLHDPRGALTRTFLEVAARYRPRWILWENVPGVRSSDDGAAFGSFIAGLGELGYGYAWASLDAQYFGLAQRRERVFVVASSRGWQCAAAVLFDASCMRGDPAPCRETREGVAGTLREGAGRRGGTQDESGGNGLIAETLRSHPRPGSNSVGAMVAGTLQSSGKAAGSATQQDAEAGLLVASGVGTAFGGNNTAGPIDVATACNAHGGSGRMDFESETFIAHALTASGFDASEDGTGRGTPLVPVVTVNARQDPDVDVDVDVDVVGPLDTDGGSHAVAFDCKAGVGPGASVEKSPTLRAMNAANSNPNAGGQVAVTTAFGVRRMTPRECERLQGFPDDYTLIPYRGKPAADGPRYAALGNSWAVPAVRWIGERIEMVDALVELQEAAA